MSVEIKRVMNQKEMDDFHLFLMISSGVREHCYSLIKIQKRGGFEVSDKIDVYRSCISILYMELGIKISLETIKICLDIIESHVGHIEELEQRIKTILSSDKKSDNDLMEAIRS
jgi:hypothetical protein